jgi:hypothetical protein
MGSRRFSLTGGFFWGHRFSLTEKIISPYSRMRVKGARMVAEDARLSERSAFLFQHLVAMFETLALQQLGKLVNPITGNAEMDLRQARITIDMLEMVREKTVGNLSPEEKQLLEDVLTELQMNYVDESRREKNKEKGNV